MPINNWWESDPSEIYWMEIRQDALGLGEYLLAPHRDASGGETWSYTLTSYVQPGDRVFHWHRAEDGTPAIIGWSEATGPLETIPWQWQARGTRGRARGVPTAGDAWRMPLTNYSNLDEPLTRPLLNEHRAEILTILSDVAEYAGKPIYAPFQNYGNRELRAQQGYLTKFPAALVDLLFEQPTARATPTPTERKRTARTSREQGYLSDAEKRIALEEHSVAMAVEHYVAAGASKVEKRGKPFDLLVVLDGVERHVEVKGSVGVSLESVQLTQGEVDHANSFQPTDLFVVDSIVAQRNDDGTLSTSGGDVRLWPNWVPEAASLRPTHLRYTLPN